MVLLGREFGDVLLRGREYDIHRDFAGSCRQGGAELHASQSTSLVPFHPIPYHFTIPFHGTGVRGAAGGVQAARRMMHRTRVATEIKL